MKDAQSSSTPRKDGRHRVWDPFVRLFHWLLVLSAGTALATGLALDASWVRLHLVSGIIAVLLVLARIVWGFTGTAYARFSQFVPAQEEVLKHLIFSNRPQRHIGHNPLGALMVLALIAAVLGLGLTGIAYLGAALKTGPLAAFLPATFAWVWGGFHSLLGKIVLGLVILHIGGVVFESRRSRENLARAMVTGHKPARRGDITASTRPVHWLMALTLTAGLGASLVGGSYAMSRLPVAAQPVATLPQVYLDECEACHMAYHPALRSAASWRLIMATLEDHFGEDASLSQQTRQEIEAFLLAHTAETVDSRPSAAWRNLKETAPIALPETATWQHIHERLSDAVFQRKAIYSRSNCAACHRDALQGWFSPFSLSIPTEKLP